MRAGRVTAADVDPADATRADLARLMVGRSVLESLDRAPVTPGRVVLSIQDVSALNDRGRPALQGVSLDVAAGEIVGIAAVAGNGQAELAEAITGLRGCTGRILVDGQDVANRPAWRCDQGRRRTHPGGPRRRRQRAQPLDRGQRRS